MTRLSVACIVEGVGEVSALPVLIRRIFLELIPDCWPDIKPPIRLDRAKLSKPGELERRIELAVEKATAVVILFDSDDDCPSKLAATLKARAAQSRSDVDTAVVIANREYEAWFIAAARSLSLLSGDEASPPDPESIRGAKAWVNKRLTTGYAPAADQAALTATMSLEEARRARSFDKLVRDLITLAQRAAT